MITSLRLRLVLRLSLTLSLSLFLSACAPLCPQGSLPHPTTRTAILSRLHASTHAAFCFSPTRGRGVITNATLLLDDNASLDELTAQTAHLLVHLRDRLGDGCARGLAAAEQSEHEASAVEARRREQYGLPPAPDSTPTLEDYRHRCRAIAAP